MGNVDLIALINQIDENSDELVNLHQDLIKIESVNTGYMPTGNETQVAEFCSKRGIKNIIFFSSGAVYEGSCGSASQETDEINTV